MTTNARLLEAAPATSPFVRSLTARRPPHPGHQKPIAALGQ